MRPATETMIKLLDRTDRKRRRLFLVERTTSHIVRPALLQRNLLVDNIDNIDFGQKLVNEIGWNHDSAGRMPVFSSDGIKVGSFRIVGRIR